MVKEKASVLFYYFLKKIIKNMKKKKKKNKRLIKMIKDFDLEMKEYDDNYRLEIVGSHGNLKDRIYKVKLSNEESDLVDYIYIHYGTNAFDVYTRINKYISKVEEYERLREKISLLAKGDKNRLISKR